MKKFYLLILSIFAVGAVAAQTGKTSVSGKIVDAATGEPLIGVSVTVPDASSAIGTATDINGDFTLAVPAKTDHVEISYIGYKTLLQQVSRGKDTNLGQIKLEMDSQMMEDVVITQSVAVQRKTPVAVSSVDLAYIEEKLGGQEFPEILKSTPGVHARARGGGFGDSAISMRGFDNTNLSVMINGVPVNDMENGTVYWSNWAGLSDVTRSMQTQRGLGASKVSGPSVGGTINIVTKGIEAKAGGTASYSIGNDNNQSVVVSASTGVTKNGWAITILGGHSWGNGYILGTEYEGWNYFANISKRINANHQLSLTAFGAPQWHNQRNANNALTIEGWQTWGKKAMGGEKSAYKWNPAYGYDKNGKPRFQNHNVYHKPQISLNHQWQINENQSLSTAAYVSISSGYGYSGQGRTSDYRNKWYAVTNGNVNTTFRKADGSFDYGAIQEMNANSPTGSNMVMATSGNSHQWYGLLSTYTNHLTDRLELSAGLDVRYYIGQHTNRIIDLYDGAYFIDDNSRASANMKVENNSKAADPNWVYQKLGVGDVVYRDYDGHVFQGGVFGQLEYSTPRLSAFVSGSIADNSSWRIDRFYYEKGKQRSATINHVGGTVKGGVNYNIDLYNNVFFNTGFISRTPFFRKGIFFNQETSHIANPNAVNEKIFSAELGYGFHNKSIALNVNAYYTLWLDKAMPNSANITYTGPDGNTINDTAMINLEGVDARHMGIELDFKAHATPWLDINAMFSWGDWQWNSNATGFWYNSAGEAISDTRGGVASVPGVTEWTPEVEAKYGVSEADFKAHAYTTVNIKGVKVGDSAQTTAMIGATFKPLPGLRIGADWNVYARTYAAFSLSDPAINGTMNYGTPWMIPWGHELDINASYSFNVTKRIRATIYGNINNVLDNQYITEATDGGSHDWDTAYGVLYRMGRRFTVRLKINF